jgi:beta-glucosidase
MYEFGFGLSYTNFSMSSQLKVNVVQGLKAMADESLGKAPVGLKNLWTPVASVEVEVTNVGSVSGSAVPQLYLEFPQDSTPSGTPLRVLRDFEKMLVGAGEVKNVAFELTTKDVSYWDVGKQRWTIPRGTFGVKVGFSSRDLKASANVTLVGA